MTKNCTELWAVIAKGNGNGIVSFGPSIDKQKPLVTSNVEMLKYFRKVALDLSKQHNTSFELVKYKEESRQEIVKES